MSDKFDKLVVNLSLIFWFSLFFCNLSVKHSEELRFEKHLMKCDEDFKDEFENLGERIFEPDSIGYGSLICDEFISMQFDQITELLIDDFELFSDELLK